MQLPQGATVAIVDGAKLRLFRNTGHETPNLTALPEPATNDDNKSSGARHQSSSANPDDRQLDEDGHAAGVAAWLNKQVLEGRIDKLVVVAAPRTLGEMRKHYHKQLEAALAGEIDKDLTGRSVAEIATAISHA